MSHPNLAQTRVGGFRPPSSTANTIVSVDEIEFVRWMVATVIAVLILVLLTAIGFLIDGMWRQTGSDVLQTGAPLLDPSSELLRAVPCNSTLCLRYTDLISSCAGHGGGSPCDGLSHFVCGEGTCYGRPFESLLRGYLRALAADALASWRAVVHNTVWPPVDRASDLYLECREMANNNDDDSMTNVFQSASTRELSSFLDKNETAGEMAARLAARYQDGVLFWLDAAGPRPGESKRRLLVRPNRQFLQRAELSDSLSGQRRLRRWASSARGGATDFSRTADDGSTVNDNTESILTGMTNVKMLLRQAGNLQVYTPELVAVAELDQYGLSSTVLIRELNRDGGSTFSSNDTVEVPNNAMLPFLSKVLSLTNIKPYLAWEFLRHRTACFASSRSQEWTLTDSCFDCVERVAGLAAHAPFLYISSEVESQAKVTVFLTTLKNLVVTSVGNAKWLSPTQQQLMLERLYNIHFTIGVPARKNSAALLNDHYDYLPAATGDFARDFAEATHATWNATLRRTSGPLFPLLSAFPNVLTAKGSAYIPAVALVPPLFSYGIAAHANFGFLGVALIRSMLHNLGLTGLQKPPEPQSVNAAASHLGRLVRCLGLNRSSTQAHASHVADALAVGVAVRGFLEGHLENAAAEEHNVLIDVCLLTCTSEDPHRCDVPAVLADEFGAAFSCQPKSAMMANVTKCSLW
ncbi:hypothetical protein HPB50_024429 [Hyalomma asiaticum]|uniref:Uncharacterized protein n=1 Tax=Hyalomma asiaticum TaxID=266040 RepID=A0ACB7S375_HYAAI|nr:hypothetical protein HPB50_024429 [Hyalomma asiaticum]